MLKWSTVWYIPLWSSPHSTSTDRVVISLDAAYRREGPEHQCASLYRWLRLVTSNTNWRNITNPYAWRTSMAERAIFLKMVTNKKNGMHQGTSKNIFFKFLTVNFIQYLALQDITCSWTVWNFSYLHSSQNCAKLCMRCHRRVAKCTWMIQVWH